MVITVVLNVLEINGVLLSLSEVVPVRDESPTSVVLEVGSVASGTIMVSSNLSLGL